MTVCGAFVDATPLLLVVGVADMIDVLTSVVPGGIVV